MVNSRLIICLALTGGGWLFGKLDASAAGYSLRGGALSGGRTSSSAASATSQTSTSATDTTSQNVQTSTATQQAQSSFSRSLQALQAMQAAQVKARASASNGSNNLGLDPSNPTTSLPNVPDGLGVGGLMPTGGLTQLANGSAIQILELGAGNKISLSNGGTIALPKGTPGNDTVSVTGSGSITSSGSGVTANSGSLTTASGGTLSTTAGGLIVVTGTSSKLSVVTATDLTSTLGGTVTLPNNGGTATFTAGQVLALPAGSTVTFSGTSAGTVSIAASSTTSTVSLVGAGTLTLAGTNTAGTGGTITTNSGTVSFTSGISSTLPAGATISLSGSGTVDFGTGTGGAIPVIVPNTSSFTTAAPILNTTGYNVPGSWTNVGALSQSTDPTTSHITDTITQIGQQALLYWDSFNIGKNTTLSFDQSKGGANVNQWVAINEITDPSLHPSQILGAIEAPGQVYVINGNGIIFGGSSQVNVGALTASSLALNPVYVTNGLLNDAGNDYQFQFSSLEITTTAQTGPRGHKVTTTTVAPLWTAPPPPPAGGTETITAAPAGDVVVQAGAQLSSPTNANNQGGRIALIGPNVSNAGTISTPDGQTILAAGLQVGLAAHNSNDASLRGLDVYIGQVSADAGMLPTGTFTFNGLTSGNQLTFGGSGDIGTYTTADGTITTIEGGSTVTIPIGSTVALNDGAPSFAAVHAGTATNAGNTVDVSGNIIAPGGDIEAARANVTLAGATVNQLGIINSSTSVTLNGRVDLLADYGAAAETSSGQTAFHLFDTGTVTLGGQSSTQILPETSSSATTIGTSLAYSSLINIQGQSVEMDSGSLIYAPGANAASGSAALDLTGATLNSGVTINAGSWYQIGSNFGQILSFFSNDSGSIALDTGSTIDVSGSQNVSASVAEDIIPVQLRGPELANSPLQRNGSLRGTTVYVDIRNVGVSNGQPWIGTPIGDVSGYVNDVQRTVGELTVNGGTVALNAGSAVSIQSGAGVNVSGGWINYAGATVPTTEVQSGGQLINISQATPNTVYGGIYNGFRQTSSKWGVTQTFLNSLLAGTENEAGYVQGGNGGGISITAPTMTLAGNFYGNTVAGAQQRTPVSVLSSTYAGATFLPTLLAESATPTAAQFNVSFLQKVNDQVSNVYGLTSPNVTFQTDSYIAQNAPAANEVLLSDDLVNSDGFGTVNIDTSAGGNIVIPQGVALTTVPDGSITFSAANIDIEGSMSAPGGGGLHFKVLDVSPFDVGIRLTTPPADPTRGRFVLGPDASLSSSGLLINDLPTASTPSTQTIATSGGSISISGLNVQLAVGSKIDVSGGALLSASGQVTYGNAGSISILGGVDPAFGSITGGGELLLGSTLTGYSGKVGGAGSVTIQSPLVQIGGATLQNGDSSGTVFVSGTTGLQSNGTTLWLNSSSGTGSDFFSANGFGSFTLDGLGQIETQGGHYLFDAAGNPIISPAVLVTAGTTVQPLVDSWTVDTTGAMPVLVALDAAQEAALLPSQRTAANLVFNAEGIVAGFSDTNPPTADGGTFVNASGGGGLLVRGDIVVQAGASIVTDPQTNSSHGVSLQALHGTVAVLGDIVAPGGTINIAAGNNGSDSSNRLLFYNSDPNLPFATVDLAPGSLLSTAGTVEQSVNSLGYLTGTVLPGGTISISGNIIAESGATLDVSGSSARLYENPASLGLQTRQLTGLNPVAATVASNGGTLSLYGTQMLYCDATLLGAAGGTNAQGGTLSVSAGFSTGVSTPPDPRTVTLIVTQQGLYNGQSVPTDALSGQAVLGQSIGSIANAPGATVNSALLGPEVYSYFAASPNLFANGAADASLIDNGGKAGGFGSLNLPGTLDFIGAVNISTRNSISLALSSGSVNSGDSGGVIYANAPVVLSSSYVNLNSYANSYTGDTLTNYPAATSGAGSLTVNASSLADVGNLSLLNIGTLSFNAGTGTAGDIRGVGTLQVAGRINLNAAQIYPPTESTFTIEADDVAITAPSGETLPSLPLSAGGTLNIEATTIEQGGVLRAPFGTINLGTAAAQQVTLSAGSVTSVSAVDPNTGKGITIPYGIVDASGNWFDPLGNNITETGPPAKAVNLAGQNIQIQSGSKIDVSGGGDLYAYSFSAGTGGNQDILGSLGNNLSSTSFAVVPSYNLDYAPEGAYGSSNNLQTNNVTDAGYYNSALQVGEQIYLGASNGLAAGVYTLLPARYALLPGAFLISPQGTAASATSVLQADGTSLVPGYLTSGLNPVTSPVFGSYKVTAQAQVLNAAPYTINLADQFFPNSAKNSGVATPRLPEDAGQLVLNATQAMSIQGTLLAQAAAGGLGGEVDIASPEEIVIAGPNTENIPAGALVLDSSQLTGFGSASLLIGGYRTTTSQGTTVTVTTNDLLVDNAGAVTTVGGVTVNGLAAEDVTLVSGGTLALADGASVEQLGQLSGAAPTLTVLGDGSLLRISSDSSAQIVRQNVVPGDTTSLLTIGQGVHIENAAGGAVGALTLDSTGQINLNSSAAAPPVLMGTSLTLDSSLINLEVSAPTTAPTTGLVITSTELSSLLASSKSLSLLSYSSIALYGSGQIGSVTVGTGGKKTYQDASLALHAGEIYYADTQNSAGITIDAQNVSLDNLPGDTALPSLAGLGNSSLTINAETISIGSNVMHLDQFTNVALNADSAVLLKGLGATVADSDAAATPAGLTVGGNLTMTTPLITTAASADQAVSGTTTAMIDVAVNATGALVVQAPATTGPASPASGALGAILGLSGSSVDLASGNIVLHSGSISLQAKGTSGPAGGSDVTVDGRIDASGIAQTFFDLTKYSSGGSVVLTSTTGNVVEGSGGDITVAAASGSGTSESGAGNGGSVSIAAAGIFTPGKMEGAGSVVTQGTGTATQVIAQGNGGSFSLDAGSLDASGAGNPSISTVESVLSGFATQSIRDRNDTTVTIDGTVTASAFSLAADQGSILVSGTVDASNLHPGGTGGTIVLVAGKGVTLQSTALLTVAGAQLNDAGQGGSVTIDADTHEVPDGTSSSDPINLAGQIDLSVGGSAGGTLNLRAAQINGGTDVAISAVANGVVKNAGSIGVEGFNVQDAQQSNALIDNFEAGAESNAAAFMSHAADIQARIFGSAANVHVRPGEEIDNSAGSLELASNWDLSTLRYNGEPGVLTIRAAGSVTIDFGASLTDGFDGTGGVSYMNPLLPVGSQSWAYNITAGADFTAANLGAVQSSSALLASGSAGNFEIGVQNSSSPIILTTFATNSQAPFFQTVRTGTGNITINAGGDVLLLNNLATIYTAGSQVDPTLGGTFAGPEGTNDRIAVPATYSQGGGNVTIAAQGDIAHEAYTADGSALVADSSAELPTNWLDREGAVSGSSVVTPTTWWVDFTNYFEGIGALGGGNVSLTAGGSVINVDASVPTNARQVNGQLTQLGGGDLSVRAGNNIDGGVYYVERGQATLVAGGNIQSNASRAAVSLGQPSTAADWLPTTFFLGDGSISLQAGGSLLFGPVANAFLLPQSYNNIASPTDTSSELSYFSTYGATDSVNASSLAGTVTIKSSPDGGAEGSLYAWYTNVLDAPVSNPTSNNELSGFEPWLILAESVVQQAINAEIGPAQTLPVGSPQNIFGGVSALLPPTLRVTAFGGDIDLLGNLTLAPSAVGTADLLAEGSIEAFQVNSVTTAGVVSSLWGSGLVNISDADPNALPSINSPFSSGGQLLNLDANFTDTGATQGITLQTKSNLHANEGDTTLHAADPVPVYIYSETGDISGLTLFSPKQTQVSAAQNITDIGLYIQNNNATDVSVVNAGGDIIAYDAASPSRLQAANSFLGFNSSDDPLGAGAGAPNTGDIQISGPGTLEVLAGRNLTLGNDAGVTPNNSLSGDGLYTGLTSVGGLRNPALQATSGASIFAAAGLGGGASSSGFSSASSMDFTAFIAQYLNPASSSAGTYLQDLAPSLGLGGGSTDEEIWAVFQGKPVAEQDKLALDTFYRVLRDAGRNHNISGNPGYGNFDAANQAIAELFPASNTYAGNIDITSREIKTSVGGDINLLVPGGEVTVGVDVSAGQAVDQGILTVDGGNISIFANDNVNVGTSRIFTLHGGNEIIWSTIGNIDAGASSKTVVSAPPTEVVVDPTSGAVQVNLAGLATGGGIGVLASVVGAPPGDVDLIAPVGIVDAGDAGIRASGNLNIAALKVVNADNISVGGHSSGVPAAASVNVGALSSASSAAGSAVAAAQNAGPGKGNSNSGDTQDLPSIVTVDVLGYGGGDTD